MFSINGRSWQDALPLAWAFLQKTITDVHDHTCWQAFSESYAKVFFGTDDTQRLQIYYQVTPADDAQRRLPPAKLVELLPDFVVSLLPEFAPVVVLRSNEVDAEENEA